MKISESSLDPLSPYSRQPSRPLTRRKEPEPDYDVFDMFQSQVVQVESKSYLSKDNYHSDMNMLFA